MNDFEIISLLKQKFKRDVFITTASILDMKMNSLHFIRDNKFKDYIKSDMKNVHIIVLKDFIYHNNNSNLNFYHVNDVLYVFGEIHNFIHQNDGFYLENNIHKTAKIHSSVSLDTEGIRLFHTPEGKKQLIHISNIEIREGATVGANTVIHKGVFQPTIIGKYAIIGSLVNIGHNCFIDNYTVITPGCVLAGRVRIGKNCWIGINSSFKHGVEVCDNVVIGQHSNVREHIIKSGIYAGEPLKKIKDYEKGWNF